MRTFNRGLALGEGFCNREIELKQLSHNLNNFTHTVLISPRRYGKTSLAIKAIEQEKQLYAHIDLFMKYNKDEIIYSFYEQISGLISCLIKPTQKALKIIGSFLKHIKIALIWGKTGVEFSLTPQNEKKQSLKLLLEGLDQFLIKQKKTVILFVDEMQTIVDSDIRDEFEADLRFIAQKTQNITFIFSGSSRHLLSKMFDDRSRPFYKLCHQMHVKKIGAVHYHRHVNKFAFKKWRNKINSDVLAMITNYTACHPYYFNILCDKLFQLPDLPDESAVTRCWQEVCNEEQSSVGKDLEFLSPKQRQLLAAIARNPELREPTAKIFVNTVNLTAKGILDSLKILYQHDLIEKDETNRIIVIDPVLAYWAQA
ncbi:MAG: hypothetical protein K2Q14_02725 [Gammaproteobacteria bacterium]|nr:hypothetical protein [Gammaproteobacteria bacterium]